MPRWTEANRTPLGRLRIQAGLSQAQAAVTMGVGLNSLGQYETGRREIPLSTAQKMATLYGVTLEKIAEAANQK